MSIPHFEFTLASPFNARNGYITLDSEKIHHINKNDVSNFYQALGYTDEIKKTGLLPEEFIWTEYHKDNSVKVEVCLQANIIEYLFKHSSVFRTNYYEQLGYWLGSCSEVKIQERNCCTNCLMHPKQIGLSKEN